MTYQLQNLSRRSVSIRLNTGVTRHVPPRSSIGDLRAGEIENNSGIETLAGRDVIKVREAAEPAAGAAARQRRARKKQAKKKEKEHGSQAPKPAP